MPVSPLLDPEALQRAEQLGMEARSIVEGYLAGGHRSPVHGPAVEFAQHREYVPGDDPRHLDWKVLGRTDRYHIKQYVRQTNHVAHLLIDGSESMNYGSGAQTKLDYARTMAACLAYLMLLQGDAVSVGVLGEKLREIQPRTHTPASIHQICAALTAFQPTESATISGALEEVARQLPRRGICVVISDLLDDEGTVVKGLQRLRRGDHEIIVFHMLDPQEVDFTFHHSVAFHGLERQGRITARPAEIRPSYLAEFGAFLNRMRLEIESEGCQYVRARTDQAWATTLTAFLAAREHRHG